MAMILIVGIVVWFFAGPAVAASVVAVLLIGGFLLAVATS